MQRNETVKQLEKVLQNANEAAQKNEDYAQNDDFIDANCEYKHSDNADCVANSACGKTECAQADECEDKNTDGTVNGDNADDIDEGKYGKFKNPQELLKAYTELEKEFTRRSQRLAKLENEAAIPFDSEESWKAAVDKFFEETPSAKAFAKDIANVLIANPQLKEDRRCFDIALTRVLVDKFRTPEQLMSDGEFLEKYVFGSQKVKDAIIAAYLKEVSEGKPPRTLGDGGLQCVAPKLKPKSIEEAGFMFLKNNN